MDREEIHRRKMEALEGAWEAARNDHDYLPYLNALNNYQLQEISADSELGINHVRIFASGPGGRVCPACKALGDMVMKLSMELNNQSLPNPNCTCTAFNEDQEGFCLCYYEPVFDDEL